MTMAWNRSGFHSIFFLLGIVASFNIFAATPPGAESISKGRALYMSNCTACHGNDGKSQVDVVSNATDLTEPLLYHNGTTDADITRSIRDGVGGVMPAWGAVFNNEESIENLKNFIKSLWPTKK
ncbi:MAG: c-type cytochrome [Rhodocyclaceae bacterium]|nr:c-type cytochrome [Rhodocyclaceae bacterium]